MKEKKQHQLTSIDMRGQVCPATMLVALDVINKHAEKMKSEGVSLCILTDNRDATNTIPDIATKMGFTVEVTREDRHYRICLSYAQ
jgi:TusA-related sulfurtransferase